MSDSFFIQITDQWAITADDNQWIVLTRRIKGGASSWRPVSFVGGKKAGLRDILIRRGAIHPDTANASVTSFLESEPHRFLDWRASLLREAA